MKRVLVIDANQRSALAVTRSLGRKGVSVHTADATQDALAGHSNFSQQYHHYPSPRRNPESFIASIIQICTSNRIDIVLPMTELTTSLLLSAKDALHGIILPFAPLETVSMLSDKCSLVQMSGALDIAVPPSRIAEAGTTDLSGITSTPIVLKPGKSWLRHNGKWIQTGVRIASNVVDAKAVLINDPAFSAGPYLVQEYVPGSGAGIFAIYDHGRPLAFFAHRRLREKPPRGGVSVLSESIPLDPTLEAAARRLLGKVEWHGVAMVEFRISNDGVPYLMEVNTRFWGSLQLAVDAGVDFPWLLYQVAAGDSPQPVTRYRTGRRLRWLLGDLDSLYLVLRDSSFTFREKMLALINFVTPAPFRTRHEVNRLSDMGPFWHEVGAYLRDLVH